MKLISAQSIIREKFDNYDLLIKIHIMKHTNLLQEKKKELLKQNVPALKLQAIRS